MTACKTDPQPAGRKPRTTTRARRVIGVRVTDDEHATITTAAGDEGASPFLRRVGMDAATRDAIHAHATRTGKSRATVAGDALEVGIKIKTGEVEDE